ncbi:MAG: hypothetical protein Q8P28_07595 [Deltaproteobacteria bacterium]|nr:hypothetical protein [Deltaproteobacteria bacterium]
MNKKKLKTLRGWVRVHPAPKIEIRANVALPDLWFVEDVTDNHIRLSYPSTGHSKDIGLDHFIEYRTDSFVHMGIVSKGILIFKTQIIIIGNRVILEPLSRPPISPKIS